jgi:23S rRNA (guanosine2251-2'-O)-methyltransferase
LLLDQPSFVRNFGTIIRIAECTGVDGIILQKRSIFRNGRYQKTSAGNAYKGPIKKVDNLKNAVLYLPKNLR